MQIAFLRPAKSCIRESLHSTSRRFYTSTSTQDDLRRLMLCCAQQVAIVTTRLGRESLGPFQSKNFHGATISSFSSVAMYPYPTIAFSLQLPSRLASTLRAPTPAPVEHDRRSAQPHLVVNLLSSTQENLARRFSRPDIHPHPFEGLDESTQLLMTAERQPYFYDNVGSLSCSIFQSIPLTLGHSLTLPGGDDCHDSPILGSELFIARVIRIEGENGDPKRSPLVYHQRSFKSVK